MGRGSTRSSPSRALSPGTRLGRYVVVDRIGRGGMAEVHLARAQGLSGFEKVVALKVIHGHLVDDPMHVELLLKEARVAATLDHPSIVQVFDVGVDAGEYYLCMEYVHGVDARQILRALAGQSRVPLRLALLVVHEVAAALHYAHTRRDPQGRPLGIVHRDVSPSNVIIAFEGAVKLTDFGIAKVTAHTSHTSTGTLKGKFGYMSPEQSMQQTIDARSDVFALGVLLYELTTGRRAFAGESAFAAMNAVIEGIYTPPEAIAPDYPPALSAIVRRALAVDPGDRHPTAEALRLEIDAVARELGGPATLSELGRFVGDLFAWPPMPDISAVSTPGAPGDTEVLSGPVIDDGATRRPGPVLLAGIGMALVAVVVAGLAGWHAGRSTSTDAASVDADRTSADDAPDSTSSPAATAPPGPTPDANVSTASVADASTVEAGSPPGDVGAPPAASPIVEQPEPSRTPNKRKRRRGHRRRAGDRSASGNGGIEAILPPSARRDP